MCRHFMQQELPPSRARHLHREATDVSFTPAWAEGAVQTALNAVWGIAAHFGGASHPENPGPGDKFHLLGPVDLGLE